MVGVASAGTNQTPTIATTYGIYFRPSTGVLTAVNVGATSDARTKTNIQTITNALDTVLKLRGVSYTSTLEQADNIGVIAQEIQEVVPQVVRVNNQGYLSVSYGNIVGLLIEAIKELKAEINDVKKKLP
ncbi:MAG: tail fiber domain-containing protein [Synechococcus sp.]|nr:tail fiber domain-containing protein [Synechococcus sp.]